ncbi:MAG: hypothetical protein BGO49_31115 [Planctomycetales bacterium 71-10]|nr:MAG: hypothetical protein BGO49_31115 [Planctomycetales bacterium 71-10]
MGTSKSNGGPKDKIPLLPEWALPPPEEEEPPPEEADENEGEDQAGGEGEPDVGDGDDAEGEGGSEAEGDEDAEHEEDDREPSSAAESTTWRSARIRLNKAIKKRGDRRAFFKQAAQSYTRARGGAGQAARNSPSGRSATARLGGFLSDVARRGLNAALEGLNLGSVVGKDARTVFAAISNALSPDGSSPEQAVAREAVNDVLADLYDRFVGPDGDLAKLDALTGEDVTASVVDSVSAYIYRRWLQELGKQIEKKAVSPSEAVGLEREAKLFVKDAVRLDFKSVNPLAIDWTAAGRLMIDDIYNQAYLLFGAG